MNYKLNTMEDLKSCDQCNLKTTSSRGTACQLTVEEEIVLDLTGSKMPCIQKQVTTFNNKLPQKNSGYEKNSLKISRTKPQMLGNLSFREIAEKRKEMLKVCSVEHSENDVPSLTSVPATDSSLKCDERDEEKSLENTTFINPHMLVGKTITLEQGGIRRIKFLSQDSNTSSNKKLLKLDELQLTPKIILRKSKQGFLPSNQTQRNCKDLSKINYCQKMSEHVSMHSDKNSVELCVQPRFKSLPHTHSIAHDLSSSTEFEKKELTRKNSELLMQKFSNEKDDCNYSTENVVDIQREREENVTKCTLLNSSHDNLTILSQVACGDFEINNQLESKEVTKNTLSVKEKVQDSRHHLKKFKYVSLDHSYQQKHQPSKGAHCYEHSANVIPMKTKPCISKRVEQISQPSSQINKIHFEEKPMFAWCTQYITHRTWLNDHSVAKQYKLPSNQEPKFCVGNKTLPKSLNSNDNSKSQHNRQKQDHPFKSNKISKKTLHFVGTSKESLSLRTPHAKEIFKGTMPSKSQLCCENEDRKDSLVDTAEITVETFVSSKENLSEMNDEVIILKEILVTKSPSCNAFARKYSDISKLKNSNKRNLCATDSQTSLVRKIVTNIPTNKEQTSKLFHKSNGDHNVSKPCTEVTNNSSQTSSKGMTGNEKVHKIVNVHNLPLKTVKSQPPSLLIKPEESLNYTRECNSVCTAGNITTDSEVGKTTTYPIKKCFVLVERLNEPTPLVGEVTGISSSTSSTNVNETCCDLVSPNNRSETTEGQSEVCVHNSERKFRAKGLFKNNISYRHKVFTTSSDNNIMVPELSKVESEDVKPYMLPFVRKCKTNATTNAKTKKINVFKENISTSKDMPIESQIDNNHNHSRISTDKSFQEEADSNNSEACQGNYNNFEIELHCEEIKSHPENIIGYKHHIALGNNVNHLCKRKLKVSEQGSESVITSKKTKLPCRRSKKLIAKNIKTTMKKGNKPKTKPVDVKMKTEYKKEINNITKNKEIGIISNQENVEVPISNMNGKMVKHSPERNFSGNREIYSLLTDFTTLGCSIEPERKLRRRSANNSQKSVENIESLNGCVNEVFSKEEDPISCNQVTKNSAEMQSKAYTSLNEARFVENNNESQSENISPLKQNNCKDNLEESLDTADTVLVHPALTKPTPNSVTNNTTPVNQRYSETLVPNQSGTRQDDVQDLQIDYNLFPPMQQNILKSDKLRSDHTPSQSCNIGKSPDNVSCSQNISSRPKRLKQLKENNILVSRDLCNEKIGVRELKRKCLSLNVGTVKRKPLDFSWSDSGKNQDNVKTKYKKVKTKISKRTQEKCSSMVSNLIKLPNNGGNNSAARNRLKNKPSVSNMKIKKVISTFSDHIDSENLPTSKSIQELKGNFEESIQPNNQRQPKKLSSDKINELKNGSSLSAKAKQLQLSRQMRQNSQTLNRSCLLNSKQECLDSTDVALHIQTNNLKTNNAKRDFVDHSLLLADSSKSCLQLPSLTNCLVSPLGIENKQSLRVRRRPSLNSQSLKNKYSKLCTEEKKSILRKSKLNPLTSNNRQFDQKVTKAQKSSNNQVYCSDFSESNSTIGCVQKQEFSDSNELLNQTVITCARLNKPTLNLPTSVKTSPTNNLQPDTECPRKKSFSNNLSTASSINIQSTDSHTHISRQDDKLTTKAIKCGSSPPNSRHGKVEPTNNLKPHPSTVRDKIRLLIMEQLKRSRLGNKIALEKTPPKR